MSIKFYLQITTRSFKERGNMRRSKPVGKIKRVKVLRTPPDIDLPDTKQWVVEVFAVDEKGKRFAPSICKARDCTDGYDAKTGQNWVNAMTNEHIHPMIVMKGNLYKTIEAAKETAKGLRVYYVK